MIGDVLPRLFFGTPAAPVAGPTRSTRRLASGTRAAATVGMSKRVNPDRANTLTR